MLSEKADGKMAKAGLIPAIFVEKETSEIKYEIFIAGDQARAHQICEEFCMRGFCVACEPTTYIYTMGKEAGVRVTIINYARFPKDADSLYELARQLADNLMAGLNQGSYTVTGGGRSVFVSRREADINPLNRE